MKKNQKKPSLRKKKRELYLLIFLMLAALFGILPLFGPWIQKATADLEEVNLGDRDRAPEEGLLFLQENSLLAVLNPSSPERRVVQKIKVVVTAYSSSVWETDETPNITASGNWVRDGIIANNFLPFGTMIKIPEIYGDKIFMVEDRMSWVKGNYHVDIWFPSYWEALNFGAKITYIEILES